MRIAIVDDEEAETHDLKKMLMCFADSRRLNISYDCFADGTAFLAAISHRKYDLVFMDIYMENTDGIQTALKMRRLCPDCCLIFLTSSQEHMAQAFPCHAFDYLLKPLDQNRLLRTLYDFLRVFPENQQYLNLSVGKQIIPVLYSHLEYICTDSNYCIVRAQEQYRCRIPFNKLKSTLEKDERFCTINRGILVNLDYVDCMEDLVCRMKSGVSFPMNTKKKTELKQILINYRFNIRRKQLSRRE
ncbi:MAG: response regulator transcription factor [Lachnospiraceae bacterium]|nr:response regulator transcription factor [Lachnospiraceae bacterium]